MGRITEIISFINKKEIPNELETMSSVGSFIYSLIDPRTKEIRYVGKTNNINRRYLSHVSCNYNNTKKECWIKCLRKLGLKPLLIILEQVNEANWQEQEKKWIKFYKDKDFDLVNGTMGGDGGKLLPEIIKRISEKNKGKKILRKILINSNRGRPLTLEHKLAIGRANKGRKRKDKDTYIKCSKLLSKPISQYSLNKQFIKDWDSLIQASIYLKISIGNISNVCTGRRNTAGGFIWKFKGA